MPTDLPLSPEEITDLRACAFSTNEATGGEWWASQILRVLRAYEAASADLRAAIDLAEEAITYVPEYFDDKWGLSDTLGELKSRHPRKEEP